MYGPKEMLELEIQEQMQGDQDEGQVWNPVLASRMLQDLWPCMCQHQKGPLVSKTSNPLPS